MSQYPQLDQNIAKLRASGVSDQKIIQDAKLAGWSDDDINASYISIGAPLQIMHNAVPPTPTFIASAPEVVVAPSTPNPKGRSFFKVFGLIVILLVVAGGIVYAYKNSMLSFFSKAPYSEGNLVSGILGKFSEIKSSSYTVFGSLAVEPRDADAEPFNIKMADDLELKEKYMRDYNRAQDITSIIGMLRSVSYQTNPKLSYPSTLAQAMKSNKSGYQQVNSIVDPLTNKEYSYSVTPDRKDFRLSADFETLEAIEAVSKFNNYGQSTTTVQGKTITFTKDSSYGIYLSAKPPENFFQSMGQMATYLPPELNIQGSMTAVSDISSDKAEWKFNLEGSGDMGDLTYKVSIDALKKDLDYYLKINNIPSFFMWLVPSKGQWYKISPKKEGETNDSFAFGMDLSKSLGEMEKGYSEQKQKSLEFVKKIAILADEESLFAIKNKPTMEKVGERSLFRYDLGVKKDAVIPFYKKLLDYTSKNNANLVGGTYLADNGLLNYFESDQFSEVFDYYDKNTSTTVWVDSDGFLAAIEYSIRVVPPEESASLKDKQVRVKISASFNNINEPVNIEIPEGAKPIEEATNGTLNSLSSARMKARSASIKANLASIRPSAEIAFDKYNSYGTKAFPLGPCKDTAGTLFADQNIYNAITSASVNGISSTTPAMCVSEMKNGLVKTYAVSIALPDSPDYSYCVDSAGNSREILGSLKGAVCK